MLLELMEGSMHAPLTRTPKGEGDQSMWRRPCRRKSPILSVVSARRVWIKLDCLNPSPTGLTWDTNGRWLLTLGPAPRAVSLLNGSIHRRWQTLSTRVTKDKREAWSTSYLTLLKRRDDLNRVTPAWLRRLNITQRTAVIACADRESGTDRRISRR